MFITIAALNMIISLFYYLKVVRAVFMDKNDFPVEKITIQFSTKLALVISSTGIILAGIFSWIYDYIKALS